MRLLLLLLLVTQVSAQEMSLRKGIVLDSLSVNDSINDSYSLYLPTKFNGSTPLPVIFILDGEGRGQAAARLFQPSAETQGYILASSNDIRTENEFEANVLTGVRLIQGVSRSIPIDFDNISVIGFSEGARVATVLPLLLNDLNGIVYIGDQQIALDMLQEPGNLIMLGMAGDEQLEGPTMELVSEQLRRAGVRAEFFKFVGGKEWPDPRFAASAVGSLTLHAIRNGKLSQNSKLVEDLFSADISIANSFISRERYLLADDFLELLQNKFNGQRDISEVKAKQRELRRTRNYKDQVIEFEKAIEKENSLRDEFLYFLEEDVTNGNFENLGWWNYQRLQLDSLISSEKSFEPAMGSRLLNLMRQMTRLVVTEIAGSASLESKLMANMLVTIFDQQNFEAYKSILSLSAIDGDFPTALFYLEEMMKNGYSDRDSLYEIEGTLGLKLTKEFNWLIDKYLGSSRYYSSF